MIGMLCYCNVPRVCVLPLATLLPEDFKVSPNSNWQYHNSAMQYTPYMTLGNPTFVQLQVTGADPGTWATAMRACKLCNSYLYHPHAWPLTPCASFAAASDGSEPQHKGPDNKGPQSMQFLPVHPGPGAAAHAQQQPQRHSRSQCHLPAGARQLRQHWQLLFQQHCSRQCD